MAETPTRIAVVCYGWETNNRHVAGYDHVIAVNRASGCVFAEYTACADHEALETFVPLNAQTVFVSDTYNASRIKQMYHLPKWRIMALDPPGQYTASIFLAIWFAANALGAREINVFGARWSGHADADGYSDEAQSRTLGRWTKERKIFETLQKNLAARGIVLRRVLLDDVSDV